MSNKELVLEWEQACFVEFEIPRKDRRQVKGIIEVFNKHLSNALAAINLEVKKRQEVNPKVILTRRIRLELTEKSDDNGGGHRPMYVLTQKVGVIDQVKTAKLWTEKGWTNELIK